MNEPVFVPVRPGEAFTDFEARVLVSKVAENLASRGSTQYDVAENGYMGVRNMTLKQFWDEWAYYAITEEDLQEQRELDAMDEVDL